MFGITRFIWLHYKLKWLIVWCWILTCLWVVFFLGSEFVSISKIKSDEEHVLNFEFLGQGAFSLNPQYLNPKTPIVLDSLYASIASKIKFQDSYIHIGLKEFPHLQKLSTNRFTKINLKTKSGEDNVLSSWSIKPLHIRDGALVAEAQYLDSGSIVISIPIEAATAKDDFFDTSPCIQALKTATILDVDRLVYDDKSSYSKEVEHRILFSNKRVLFLKNQDFIYFINGQWQKTPAEKNVIGQFFLIENQATIVVVDETGFNELTIPITKKASENFIFSQYMPHSVKAYPNKMVTCFIGRQRFALRENDWVVKVGNFSQIIKSKNDLQDLLDFKKFGPLVTIENIQYMKQSCFIRGKIYSPLRMNVHPFEIEAPIIIPEKASVKHRARGVKNTVL